MTGHLVMASLLPDCCKHSASGEHCLVPRDGVLHSAQRDLADTGPGLPRHCEPEHPGAKDERRRDTHTHSELRGV